MKRIITLLSSVLLTVKLWAQAPQSFSYQAVVRGTNNTLITNKSVGMRISLLQGSDTGNTVYVETQTPTANTNGLVSIAIGNGTVVSGMFSSIDWSQGPYFIKTETDPTGGTNYQLTTVSMLMSVPYALYAANSQPGPKGDKGETGAQGPAGKDGKVEFQNFKVSKTGDTLYLTNGNYVIIPGLSLANVNSINIMDVDSNTYKTVYIGTQQWMIENLKVSKYSDGTAIPNITDYKQWSNLTTGAWSNYNNSDSIGNIYGKLYNWYAVSPTTNGNKNVCPSGWHVPTDAEWKILTDYLGGENVAGGKMKKSFTSWYSPNLGANNTSLFSALPGGYLDSTGLYYNIGTYGYWWSSTLYSSNLPLYRYLFYFGVSAYTSVGDKKNGYSVRCLKD